MRFLHRFATPIQVLSTLVLYAQLALLYTVAATPVVYLLREVWITSQAWETWPRIAVMVGSAAVGWFAFALLLCFVVGFYRIITFAGTPVGTYSYYSLKGLRWASYNALILAVRFTVMDFFRVTPFMVMFHRLMGMKAGARLQINTKVIGDSNLITIGDDTVIGGDVTLVCHAAESGNLVAAPVKIGDRVTVGLMAVILPGCEIGNDAVIAANAVLKKGCKVPANTIWAGIPARQVGERRKKPSSD